MARDMLGHPLRVHTAEQSSVLSAHTIFPSFIAVVSGADVRLAQQLGSFSCKALVSVVTRANGIYYNLSSGHLQGQCGHVELGVGMCWVCGHYLDVTEMVS